MDFTTAVSIIKKDLEEARLLLEQLSVTQVNHMAELELARSRIRSATEMISILPRLTVGEAEGKVKVEEKVEEKGKEKVESDQGKVEAEVQVQGKVEEKAEAQVKIKVEERTEIKEVVKVEVQEVVKSDVQEIVTSDVQEVVKSDVQEVVTSDVQEVVTSVKQVVETARTTETARGILADKFSGTDRLVQQVSSVRQDEAITSAMHARPITDIASAIGINDKFYFIRELFSGDGKAYVDTIRRLNSALSLGEAMKILDESTVMGSDPAAQSSFVDVVRRKFNING